MENKKNLTLIIIEPNKSQTLEIEWIEVQSPTGNFIIGPNHLPVISIIQKNSKLIFKDKKIQTETILFVSSGIFKLEDNIAKVIIENNL